jgi:uncharacterized protein YndB with AHSA1/START domain
MVMTQPDVNDLNFTIRHELLVNASIETTFDALLEQLGPQNETGDGKPFPMKLEARPGGRWYRDFGDDNGHFWAHVQAIKRPTLLEFAGPLFLSHPVANNVQYRLTVEGDGTRIVFRHSCLGPVPDEQRAGMEQGWAHMLQVARTIAEKKRKG